MKTIICSLFLTLSAAAEEQPKDVLAFVQQTYASLRAAHITAVVTRGLETHGVGASSSSEYEIAEKSGGKYSLRAKIGDQESVSVSNGAISWKALPKEKRWTKVEAAGIAGSTGESAEPVTADLRTTIRDMLIGRFYVLAKRGEQPEFVKDARFKLGKDKIDCSVIRVTLNNAVHELWIDNARGLVLQEIDVKRQNLGGEQIENTTTTKMKSVEINAAVDDSLFEFTPEPSWREVDMLLLPGENRVSLTGLKAADFSVKSLEGDTVELSSLRGKVVVLDFWATWCPPCRKELPSMDKLRAEFGGKVQFYGVNDEDTGTIKTFLRKNSYEMAVLLDQKDNVHRQFGVNAIPTVLVIDRSGVIRDHFIGGRSEETLRAAIAEAVGKE